MCELFAISFRESKDIKNELNAFFSHSVRHPHGWGLYRMAGNRYEVMKEPVRAVDSLVLPGVIESTEPQKDALAHIRLASVGIVKEENCHPYSGEDKSGRTWTLIHNGTVFYGERLEQYREKQTGTTDSERMFLHLLACLNKSFDKNEDHSERRRFDIVEDFVCGLSEGNKINLMIFDGEILYVHKNMKGTLYEKKTDGGFLFCTAPLDDEGWTDYPMCRVNAYKNGKLLFTGQKESEEFVPSPEYLASLAASKQQ